MCAGCEFVSAWQVCIPVCVCVYVCVCVRERECVCVSGGSGALEVVTGTFPKLPSRPPPNTVLRKHMHTNTGSVFISQILQPSSPSSNPVQSSQVQQDLPSSPQSRVRWASTLLLTKHSPRARQMSQKTRIAPRCCCSILLCSPRGCSLRPADTRLFFIMTTTGDKGGCGVMQHYSTDVWMC